MVATKAKTVAEYLASLPPDRRKEMAAVRKVVKKAVPRGYKESMNWGMICWEIPLSAYPRSHNAQPLCYVALAAQKQHLSLYLTAAYMFSEQAEAIRSGFKAAGKKLDMGKSCLRFRSADDLALPVITACIAAIPPGRYIMRYEEVFKGRGR